MIIVHDIFICKPGNASKMTKLFKEMMAGNSEPVNIMTDLTGQYNKVVMVTQYKSLAAYEGAFEKYKKESGEMSAKGGSASGEKKQFAKMEGYQELYLTGSREIYQTW